VIGHASLSPDESAGITPTFISLQKSRKSSTAGPSVGHAH
jgi:hypothetical protein